MWTPEVKRFKQITQNSVYSVSLQIKIKINVSKAWYNYLMWLKNKEAIPFEVANTNSGGLECKDS